jgi:hypothetical protein
VAFLNRFLLTEAADGGWLFALGVLTVPTCCCRR